ncbi:MAG: 30S ribosomal protein S15 [Candidatus Pacebacteria bacterium]|nr:30S ribosomal protein S15 [Candidatus Paceibacterota bacterium]
MSNKKELKSKAIKNVARNDTDTGSPEVQISILTEKITNLSEHLKINKKDLHSTRGLLQMVADRRRLTKYLKRKNPEAWEKLSKKLNLKK